MRLISPSFGPLEVSQAQQVLSDSNGDFAVIGICSSDAASSSVVAGLGSLLSGQQQQQQQAATATAAPLGTLQGLRMHVHPRDRLIVLDASRILSADTLAALLAPERPQPAVGAAAAAAVRAAASRAGCGGAVPVEGVAALLGLQMLCFLLAVCNVVVVGSTDLDLQLLQLLEACCHISSSIPDLTIPPAQLAQQLQQQEQQPGVRGLSSPAMHPTVREAAHEASRTSDAAVAAAARRGRGQQQPHQQQPHAKSGFSSSSSSANNRWQQQSKAVLPHHVADLVLLQSCSSQRQLAPMLLQQLQQLVDAGPDRHCMVLQAEAVVKRANVLSCAAAAAATAAPAPAAAAAAGGRKQGRHAASSSITGASIWVVPPLHGSGAVKACASRLNSNLEEQQQQAAAAARAAITPATSAGAPAGQQAACMATQQRQQQQWLLLSASV
ncbi:hypothetical protein COO60DRAFT_331938 [Scenedesmus sp. NREL 46B-D3]|nr:hypothetical protein COO60DRAFT_331938 [Scenedesmus sp. NREL 46B-D3]